VLLTNTIAEEVSIEIEEQPGGKGDGGEWPLQGVYASIASLSLVKFYEDFRPWLNIKLGNDHTKWPNAWRFGRIVRNAASHGAVHISDRSFSSVSWKGLTYGPDQDKRRIFGGDLSL